MAPSLRNLGSLPIAVDVTLFVTDPEGAEIFRHTYSWHGIAPNQENDAREACKISTTATEGKYTVGARVYLAHSGLRVYEDPSLASFHVRTVLPTATPLPANPTATSLPPPSTATVAPATSTPTSGYSLSLSTSADRASPVSLQGGAVSGDVYVFLSPVGRFK
jgi:hypothetical protein